MFNEVKKSANDTTPPPADPNKKEDKDADHDNAGRPNNPL